MASFFLLQRGLWGSLQRVSPLRTLDLVLPNDFSPSSFVWTCNVWLFQMRASTITGKTGLKSALSFVPCLNGHWKYLSSPLELCNFTETYLHMSYSFPTALLECLKCLALCLMVIWDAKSLCFSKLPQSHFAFCAFCELWIYLCMPFHSVPRPLSFFST